MKIFCVQLNNRKIADDEHPSGNDSHSKNIKCKKCATILVTAISLSLFILFASFACYNRYTRISHNIQHIGPSLIGNSSFKEDHESYFVDTPGCQMPVLPLVTHQIESFIFLPKPVKCKICGTERPLIVSDKDSIWVDEDTLKTFYNICSYAREEIVCYYEAFFRLDAAKKIATDSGYKYTGRRIPFWKKHKVSDEFVKATCILNKKPLKKVVDFHAFVPIKAAVKSNATQKLTDKEKLSVLMIGIDGVSRLNFQRTMKMTRNFLLQNMSAIEMLGYNKIGYNTFPNLIAFLTGESMEEFNINWKKSRPFFDSLHYIWDDFKEQGYRTAFGEDSYIIHTFNFELKGFRNAPTDYYYRTFSLASEKENGIVIQTEVTCIGTQPVYKKLLIYIEKFVDSMRHLPYFGLFWQNSLTHHSLNNGLLGDDEYLSLLHKLAANKTLNETVLIFLSDHGYRFGRMFMTYQGAMESNQPFIFLVFPEWFREKYVVPINNLIRNTRRLTTPFDLHETLKDLLHYTVMLDQKNLNERMNKAMEAPRNRGISLFLPISEHRTCLEADANSIWVDEGALESYNINSDARNGVDCYYEAFFRPDAKYNNASDDAYKYSGKRIHFWKKHRVSDEFVRATCILNKESTKTVVDFHAFVPIKSKDSTLKSKDDQKISVLMIGVDGVSRLHFQRTMNKTRSFLLQNMSAIEMLGYNKVGSNSFPNIFPILTGMSEAEFTDRYSSKTQYFDFLHYIWDDFKNRDYLTAYAEDFYEYSTFNYVKKGFLNVPTDYYYRPFDYASETEIGRSGNNSMTCLGTQTVFKKLLKYIEKFVTSMQNQNHPYFAFFWQNDLTHNKFNNGLLGDDDYVSLLQKLAANGTLNNTILIFLSDHGCRLEDVRKTYQGAIEDCQPLLFLAFPKWFRENYSNAINYLKINSRRLTTPFDLHKTLKDILQYRNILSEKRFQLRKDEIQGMPLKRGTSLFFPISEYRTCFNASIAPHYCTCHRIISTDVNSVTVKSGAEFIVENINVITSGSSQCARLRLQNILGARIGKLTHFDLNFFENSAPYYTLTVETQPGFGIFEATFRQTGNVFELAGDISRINRYNNDSACVDHYLLRPYCYCIENLPTVEADKDKTSNHKNQK